MDPTVGKIGAFALAISASIAVWLVSRKRLRHLLLGAGLLAALATAAYLYLVAEISVAYGGSSPRPDRDLAG